MRRPDLLPPCVPRPRRGGHACVGEVSHTTLARVGKLGRREHDDAASRRTRSSRPPINPSRRGIVNRRSRTPDPPATPTRPRGPHSGSARESSLPTGPASSKLQPLSELLVSSSSRSRGMARNPRVAPLGRHREFGASCRSTRSYCGHTCHLLARHGIFVTASLDSAESQCIRSESSRHKLPRRPGRARGLARPDGARDAVHLW